MLKIQLNSLIVMVGPVRSGRSSFVKEHFADYEIVSLPSIRKELTGNENDKQQDKLAYDEFYRRINNKLSIGERVVADAPHLRKKDRTKTAYIGSEFHVPVYYIVVDRELDQKLVNCNPDDINYITKQHKLFDSQQKDIIKGDGIATVIDLRKANDDDSDTVDIIQKFNYNDIVTDLNERGYKQFMAIGDVHGMSEDFSKVVSHAHKNNLFIIQLGDIVDYGPDPAACIDTLHRLVMFGKAMFIVGNHERKLEKYFTQLNEGNVRIQVDKGGIVKTIEQLNRLGKVKRQIFEQKFFALMNYARHHIRIGNNLFVHASATERMWDLTTSRLTGKDEHRAVFGQVNENERLDKDGYPNRIFEWHDHVPNNHTVYVGHHILSVDEPVQHIGKLGGKVWYVDTGSGKTEGRDSLGRPGKLSYIIGDIVHPNTTK